MMSKQKRVVAAIGEHFMFLAALLLMIPAVPSEMGQTYDYFPRALFVAVAAAGSRWCALLIERESWPGLVVKTGMFVAAGWVINFRVFSY